jgi:hypothetical protein
MNTEQPNTGTPKGVTVGQVTGNASPQHEEQLAEGDVVDVRQLVEVEDVDESFQDRLAGDYSTEDLQETEEAFSFSLPPDQMTVEDGKLVINVAQLGCIRKAYFTSKQAKAKPELLCNHEEGDPRCLATHLKLKLRSKWDKYIERYVARMTKAEDSLAKLNVLKQYDEAMQGAPAEKLEQGLNQLKNLL